MKQQLEALRITEKELERLTGLDISDLFIGGVIRGAYRASKLKNYRGLLSFCLTEVLVFALLVVLALPIGIALTRHLSDRMNELPAILYFLKITLGIACLTAIAWNVSMWFKAKQLKSLLHLLDDIDRYNQVIQAVIILEQLQGVGNFKATEINQNELVQALEITRDSLVSALMTEKILRHNRKLFASRDELLANLENNLTTLRALNVQNQAQEYSQLLNEALQIGLSVQKEVYSLSHLFSH